MFSSTEKQNNLLNMAVLRVVLVNLVITTFALGFSPSLFGCRFALRHLASLSASDGAGKFDAFADKFDAKSFEEALRSISPTTGKTIGTDGDAIIADIRAEQISRKYPFDDYTEQLPILPDCNNYYSGKYGDYTWHQNADQVFVYLPVDDSVMKRDVEIRFEALYVDIKINDEQIVKFSTIERLIPDGSFWVFETDKNGQKYIQLDLEKRYRMINWKNVFSEAPVTVEGEAENRRKMLESLFAANRGMSKMTGKEPEGMDEMLKNEALMKMLKEVNTTPQVTEDLDYDGEEEENIIDAETGEEEGGDEYNNKEYVVYDGSESPAVEIDPPFDVKGFVKASADKYFPKEDNAEE